MNLRKVLLAAPVGIADNNSFPYLFGAQAAEKNRLLYASFRIEVPDRGIIAGSEIHGTSTPRVVVRHDGLPILGRLDDGVDSGVSEIKLFIQILEGDACPVGPI